MLIFLIFIAQYLRGPPSRFLHLWKNTYKTLYILLLLHVKLFYYTLTSTLRDVIMFLFFLSLFLIYWNKCLDPDQTALGHYTMYAHVCLINSVGLRLQIYLYKDVMLTSHKEALSTE